MNKFGRPPCHGSDPSPQTKAEYDCRTCSFENSCHEHAVLDKKAKIHLRLLTEAGTDSLCCRIRSETAFLSGYRFALRAKGFLPND